MDDSFDSRGLVSGNIIKNEKKSEMFYVLPFCLAVCASDILRNVHWVQSNTRYILHKQYRWPGKIIIKSFSWHWKIMPIQRKYDDY